MCVCVVCESMYVRMYESMYIWYVEVVWDV